MSFLDDLLSGINSFGTNLVSDEGFAHDVASFPSTVWQDLYGTTAGTADLLDRIMSGTTAPSDALSEVGQGLKYSAMHPSETISEHPLTTALMLSGGVEGLRALRGSPTLSRLLAEERGGGTLGGEYNPEWQRAGTTPHGHTNQELNALENADNHWAVVQHLQRGHGLSEAEVTRLMNYGPEGADWRGLDLNHAQNHGLTPEQFDINARVRGSNWRVQADQGSPQASANEAMWGGEQAFAPTAEGPVSPVEEMWNKALESPDDPMSQQIIRGVLERSSLGPEGFRPLTDFKASSREFAPSMPETVAQRIEAMDAERTGLGRLMRGESEGGVGRSATLENPYVDASNYVPGEGFLARAERTGAPPEPTIEGVLGQKSPSQTLTDLVNLVRERGQGPRALPQRKFPWDADVKPWDAGGNRNAGMGPMPREGAMPWQRPNNVDMAVDVGRDTGSWLAEDSPFHQGVVSRILGQDMYNSNLNRPAGLGEPPPVPPQNPRVTLDRVLSDLATQGTPEGYGRFVGKYQPRRGAVGEDVGASRFLPEDKPPMGGSGEPFDELGFRLRMARGDRVRAEDVWRRNPYDVELMQENRQAEAALNKIQSLINRRERGLLQ